MQKDIKFMVKFGRRDHLQDIIDGKIFFTNAKRLGEIEKIKMKKGQGDSGEGRTKMAFNSARLYNTTTGKLEGEIQNSILDLGYQSVPTIPVFCLTAGYEKDLIRNPDGSVTIKFSDNIEENIRDSFDEADAALIIKTPDIFDNDLRCFFNYRCESDVIKYYEDLSKGKLYLEMIQYIAGQYKNIELSDNDYLARFTVASNRDVYYITMQNVYKVLFCKDANCFADQQEYRFVAYGFSIDKPQKLYINTEAEMEITDIDSVFTGCKCSLN